MKKYDGLVQWLTLKTGAPKFLLRGLSHAGRLRMTTQLVVLLDAIEGQRHPQIDTSAVSATSRNLSSVAMVVARKVIDARRLIPIST
jgi:hypothetical protein